MKAASPAMVAYLAANTTTFTADLLTITLVNGGIARLTTFDRDLVVSGIYKSGPTLYTRGAFKQARGLQADAMPIQIFPDPADTIGGELWLAAARLGSFDGARVAIDKCLMPSPGNTVLGSVNLFTGRVADLHVSRVSIAINAKPDLELLDLPFPGRVYQAGCGHTLFDSGCALLKALFTSTGSADVSSTANIVGSTIFGQATGYFDLGILTMTTGALAGVSRAVKTYTFGAVSTFELMRPLPAAPAASDTFTVTPGCDKLQSTCINKFNNLVHFSGAPFIPPPETAI